MTNRLPLHEPLHCRNVRGPDDTIIKDAIGNSQDKDEDCEAN